MPQQWNCVTCTLANLPEVLECVACGGGKPIVEYAAASLVWVKYGLSEHGACGNP